MLSPKTGMMSVVTNVLLGTYPELNIWYIGRKDGGGNVWNNRN
jgi:hypothetical protein